MGDVVYVQELMHTLLRTRRAQGRLGRASTDVRTYVRNQGHRRHRAAFHRARPASAADARTYVHRTWIHQGVDTKTKEIVNTLSFAGGCID